MCMGGSDCNGGGLNSAWLLYYVVIAKMKIMQ